MKTFKTWWNCFRGRHLKYVVYWRDNGCTSGHPAGKIKCENCKEEWGYCWGASGHKYKKWSHDRFMHLRTNLRNRAIGVMDEADDVVDKIFEKRKIKNENI